jgi:hypothetical protein
VISIAVGDTCWPLSVRVDPGFMGPIGHWFSHLLEVSGRWKPGSLVAVSSNSCAVPNVYQRVLVSFVLDLGTPDGRKITVNLPLLSARKNEAKNLPKNGDPKRLLNRGKPSKTGTFRGSARNPARRECPKMGTEKPL